MGIRCYSLHEAADSCGIRYKAILAAANTGELRTFVPAGMRRKRFVREDELAAWMRRMERASRRESGETDETP